MQGFFFCVFFSPAPLQPSERVGNTGLRPEPRHQLPPMNRGEEDRAIKANKQCGVFYLVAQLSRCWHPSLQQRTHCLTEEVKMTDGAEIKMLCDMMFLLAVKEQRKKRKFVSQAKEYDEVSSETCPRTYFGIPPKVKE